MQNCSSTSKEQKKKLIDCKQAIYQSIQILSTTKKCINQLQKALKKRLNIVDQEDDQLQELCYIFGAEVQLVESKVSNLRKTCRTVSFMTNFEVSFFNFLYIQQQAKKLKLKFNQQYHHLFVIKLYLFVKYLGNLYLLHFKQIAQINKNQQQNKHSKAQKCYFLHMQHQTKNNETNISNMEIPLIIEENIPKYLGGSIVKKYSRGKFLGDGAFAKCYEFKEIETGKSYAGKVIKKASLQKLSSRTRILSEIEIHKDLHNSNIVNFETVFEDANNIYMILELCPNQTLFELLETRKNLLEVEVRYYLLQMISALKYLHKKQIIHRDIKLENLFLSEKMELKLGDFGLAVKLDHKNEKRNSFCGTPQYIAPEVLTKKNGYSFEIDLWSVGVIVYALLAGELPFDSYNLHTVYSKIKGCEYSMPKNTHISEEAQDLISKIFVSDPSKRLTLDEALNHPFLTNGCQVPKLMPLFTLTRPLSEKHPKVSIPEPAVKIQNESQEAASPTAIKKMDITCENINSMDSIKMDENQNTQIPQNLKEGEKFEIDSTTNKQISEIYVIEWLDYSLKYGIGYLLSNGSIGVFFNDCSKIILDPTGRNFKYIEEAPTEKKSKKICHSICNYPESLKKKVLLLQYFQSKFEKLFCLLGYSTKETLETNKLIYVKQWKSTKHAIMFKLNNDDLQIHFSDDTKLLFESQSKMVIFVNKKNERMEYTISAAIKNQDPQLKKRIQYTLENLNDKKNI